MLAELSIKNLAIIDDLTVSFADGLTVLSGETGAGKSIIINAVNLILGNRATSRLIRTGRDSAEIEAFFTLRENSPVARLMTENGFDDQDGLLIRRIISANDRHKIFINGRMATMQMLGDITQNLAGISGQHAHQSLLKEDQHLLFLDQFGNLQPLKDTVADLHARITPLLATLSKYRALELKQAQHQEFLRFQKNDIEQAAITPKEDEVLDEQRTRLRHGEALRLIVTQAVNELYHMDGAIFERLSDLGKSMDRAAELDPTLVKTAESVTDLVYRIEDLSAQLRDYEGQIGTDSDRLDEIEARLDLLNKLKRKYAGPSGTLADVEALYAAIVTELDEVENLSTTIGDLERTIEDLHGQLVRAARELSDKRRRAAIGLSSLIVAELASLDMARTQFDVQVTPIPADEGTSPWLRDKDQAIGDTGMDRAVFMIAPNVGEAMKPLSRIASGGELSRVILALKAILAGVDSVETIIFDEVDAGIGGAVAEKVGEKIKALSAHHQVICITHLPQIAKFGDHHYKIKKTVADGRTTTVIHPLSEALRIDELARMLGGATITDATLAHAREMLRKTP